MHRMPTHTHSEFFYRCSYAAKKYLWHQSAYVDGQRPDTIALIDMLCLTPIICTVRLTSGAAAGSALAAVLPGSP
jgi:hypothetical protein